MFIVILADAENSTGRKFFSSNFNRPCHRIIISYTFLVEDKLPKQTISILKTAKTLADRRGKILKTLLNVLFF